jgi:hypothetical protein
MANLVYDFLPGSGNPHWKGHVTFASVAQKVGIGNYWPGGSKQPAIVALLERTLQFQRDKFEPLITEIVRSGIVYRNKQGNPIREQEMKALNGHILDVGFKFPPLWDRDFLASLKVDGTTRAAERFEQPVREEQLKACELNQRSCQLYELKNEFLALCSQPDRSAAGFALENLLNRLFMLFKLAPRGSFRIVGEQIDGSFTLHHEVHLVEAKWENKPLSQSPLLIFQGKIIGKSAYTRGVFIALEGISAEARDAITRGKQATFFVMTGHDLMMILAEHIDLIEFLDQRWRLLCEEGAIVAPFQELWTGSRSTE